MRNRWLPFGLGLALLTGALTATPAYAGEKAGIDRADVRAKVVHPGSSFTVLADIEASKKRAFPRDEELVVLGVFEAEGKQRPLGVIGRATVKAVGKEGVRDALVAATVPVDVGTGRLHFIAALEGQLLPLAANDAVLLAKLGVVHVLDVVPAPNLVFLRATPSPGHRRGVP